MVAVVTGAGGFIGRHLTKALVSRGESVRAMVRPGRGDFIQSGPLVEPWQADLAMEAPLAAFQDAETVYHCAAQVRPPADLSAYRRNNVTATANVLQACLDAHVHRVVHFSSVAVHGEDVDHANADEASPFANPPPNEYVSTKIEAELIGKGMIDSEDLPLTVLRPGWVYGPGDSGVLRIARQLRRGFFPVPTPPSDLLHLTYVDNVVHGALLAAQSPRALGETFFVHDHAGLSLQSFLEEFARRLDVEPRLLSVPSRLAEVGAGLAEKASRAMGRSPPVTRYQVAMLAHRQGFAIGKAQRVLGFEPVVPPLEGLRRTARWCVGVLSARAA